MEDDSLKGDEVKLLFTELKGLTQQNEIAYKAVLKLERLFLSHLENRSRYDSEEDRLKSIFRIVKAMMQVNSVVSLYDHFEKYLEPVRDLFQRFIDEE